MTKWPIYIDPISGEKLLEQTNKYNQLHLTSKNGVSYPIIKGIPRILIVKSFLLLLDAKYLIVKYLKYLL